MKVRCHPCLTDLPILYSFRRCPYAMRARMAVLVSGQQVELREVSLRAKPDALILASPKATVPVLVLPDGTVIDESLDIMAWALSLADPLGWLSPGAAMDPLIATNDGPFKTHLDRAKYPGRFGPSDPVDHYKAALALLQPLEVLLAEQPFFFGEAASLADVALFPFIRQLARIDGDRWVIEAPLGIRRWLAVWEAGPLFKAIMVKYPLWQDGALPLHFP